MSNNCDTNRVNLINFEPDTVKIAMERWRKVTFANRFMFRMVMDDPELCKRTLEVVLGINIRKLIYQEAEKSIEAQLQGREKQDLLNFVEFINTGKGKDAFTEKLEEAVRMNHEDVKKAVTYMTWEQEMQSVAVRERLAEKFEIAKKMKIKGMSVEDIIDITGLTAEELATV